MKKIFTLNNLSSGFFYFAILLFLIGFNFTDAPPPSGWYQQFMPNLNGAQIMDITFTDSLNGFAVTGLRTAGDSSYILKTTNGGDNWSIKFMHSKGFVRVEFINGNTGFTNAFTKIFKTTNAGENWSVINLSSIFGDDMFVLNENTIWLAMSEPLTGGVYRTTNGGVNWTQQFIGGIDNPDHIYMFNDSIGFISRLNSGAPSIRKTTNGGNNWFVLVNNESFTDMHFSDNLVGWKSNNGTMKKTTNSGLNWINQEFPITYASGIIRFSNVNNDTIWGVGGTIAYPNNQIRGLIYKTTDGGNNWGYQIPDTTIHIFAYYHSKFVNKLNGWSYAPVTGVHTITGGNDTTYSKIENISIQIPTEYKLHQNFPNPFNPNTKIKYEITSHIAEVRLIVYDITGREITVLVNSKHSAIGGTGVYEVSFDGSNYSSGVYFYSLIVDGQLIDTKKMLMIK